MTCQMSFENISKCNLLLTYNFSMNVITQMKTTCTLENLGPPWLKINVSLTLLMDVLKMKKKITEILLVHGQPYLTKKKKSVYEDRRHNC